MTIASFISEIGDIKNYEDSRQIVKLFAENSSGQKDINK